MILTDRDVRLIRDVVLSQVLSRDQILALGYFGSVTRANTRLRELRAAGYLTGLSTPFHGQFLYAGGKRAALVVGDRIAELLRGRKPSPRYVQHALSVSNVRLALLGRGFTEWRFEAQLRHTFRWAGRTVEVRPDGIYFDKGVPTFLEVDLGHVAPKRFAEKLKGFDAFELSGECERIWRTQQIVVLTITTGAVRRAHLSRLTPRTTSVDFRFATFAEMDIPVLGGWS